MNKISKIALVAFTLLGCKQVSTKPANAETDNMNTPVLYDFKAKTIDGKELDFSQFKGKKVLIVNTASECGFTPQYADLQKLHEQYKDKLVIIGFPCNQFGGQEPGTVGDIKTFCTKNYGVTFQMMDKVDVKGDKQDPLYSWLSDKSKNGWNGEAPSWNFCKYLIDENGHLLKYLNSNVNPMSDEITGAL